MNVDLYEWVRGPLMSATIVLFIVGLAFRVFQFFRVTTRLPHSSRNDRDPPYPKPGTQKRFRGIYHTLLKMRIHYRNSIFGMTPATMWLTVI